MKYILIIFTAFFISTVAAQDISVQVSRQVSDLRSGKTLEYQALDAAVAKQPAAVLNELSAYQADTLADVRKWVFQQYLQILLKHEKPLSLRQDITARLTEGIADKDASVRNSCVDHLSECLKADFSEQVQTRFAEIFNGGAWYSRDLLLLAGYIGNPACKPALETLAYNTPQDYRKLKWRANLALSRMGDNNAMSWCLAQVQRIGVNDDVVYELVPGLVYTRQQRAIEYLITILNSDEKLCSSSNPDSEVSMVCGYRVMEYLAPVIKNYPLKVLASGDIDTKDYNKALKTIREWFAKKKGQYEIITDGI